MELIRTIIGAGRNWPDFSVVPYLYYPLSLILSTVQRCLPNVCRYRSRQIRLGDGN